MLGVEFPGPLLARNCAEKPIYGVPILHRQGGKIAENRTLTDVNRR